LASPTRIISSATGPSPPPTTPPIFITGKTFDLYAAAVELLEQLYAMSMGDFDFLSRGPYLQTFTDKRRNSNVDWYLPSPDADHNDRPLSL